VKPIRLALVRQRYNPFGGAERFVERAMAALSEQPVALTLITRQWSGAPQHEIALCRPWYLGRLWRDWGFARCVRATIAGGHFDLVQSHERIPGCDIYRAGDGVHATWLERLGRVRGLLGRLGLRLNPWHRYTLVQERRMFRDPRLRAVICNSRMVRDDIADRFGVAPGKLHVIYNGVDGETFHPRLAGEHRAAVRARLGVAGDTPVILYVGSGFERKGVAALVAALARLPGVELWIVGADRREGRYRQQARNLGVAARVSFLGPQRDMRPWLGAADVFALPSLYDPLPNAALEALASGLPVLASRSSGVAELIEEGENGHVVAAGDVPAMASALARLTAPGVAGAMRARARAAVEHLRPETMARQLAELYRGLAAREPVPPPL
jgi:UDP-glucose:(heptosyl)LPS alpha-1,3-glucosyltransferase